MQPVVLATQRLVLSVPVEDDIEAITAACQDPLFEHYMTTPWPYRRQDAEWFVREHVPSGWRTELEPTWAIRPSADSVAVGMIGSRTYPDGAVDLGYWLSGESRGSGFMTEAVGAVIDWLRTEREVADVLWEAFPGNRASAAVARRSGFAFTGTGPSRVTPREGEAPQAWHGVHREGADTAEAWSSWDALS